MVRWVGACLTSWRSVCTGRCGGHLVRERLQVTARLGAQLRSILDGGPSATPPPGSVRLDVPLEVTLEVTLEVPLEVPLEVTLEVIL